MPQERLRVPIDSPYLHSIGLAMICFARLEWNAVWCCEKLQCGYLDTVGRKTAGQIAADLIAHVPLHTDAAVVASLSTLGHEFKRLVGRRNDLVHANPATSPNGEQRLFRHGTEWTISEIDGLADEFAALSAELNDHLHNRI